MTIWIYNNNMNIVINDWFYSINIINILHNSTGQGSLCLFGHINGAKQGYIHIQINSINLQLMASNKHTAASVINAIKISAKKDMIVFCYNTIHISNNLIQF